MASAVTGGPLACPAGLAVSFVAAAAAGIGLLMPATALAEWVARRWGLPILAQIPASGAARAFRFRPPRRQSRVRAVTAAEQGEALAAPMAWIT